MQLFVCDFEVKWNNIIIEDIDILNQLRKVLRMKIWDYFYVQRKENPDKRYKLKLLQRDNKKIYSDIQGFENKRFIQDFFSWIIVSMPNKRDKAELIVQKLSEIWINEIVLWTSERSVIRKINQSKFDRLLKISREAVEQSRWWELPKITFCEKFPSLNIDTSLVIFDIERKNNLQMNTSRKDSNSSVFGVIWPEWGLTESDYINFGDKYYMFCLWENVLRTETAAVIWWRLIKNYKI